jgi:hypothetical protein
MGRPPIYKTEEERIRAKREKAKKRAKTWRKRHPDKLKAINQARKEIKTKWERENYSTEKWYVRSGKPQPTRPRPDHCEVCGSLPIHNKKILCLDHCHETNTFRGWLCNGCNAALGMARDSPDILRALARYLEEHRATLN